MEDWKVRLIDEYKQLVDKHEKLKGALQSDDFCSKMGNEHYRLIVLQEATMSAYRFALEARLELLKISIE